MDRMRRVENRLKRLEKVTENNRVEIMRVYKNLPKIYARLKKLESVEK